MQCRVASLAPRRLETLLTRCARHIRMNFIFTVLYNSLINLKKYKYDLIVVPEKIFVILPDVSSVSCSYQKLYN